MIKIPIIARLAILITFMMPAVSCGDLEIIDNETIEEYAEHYLRTYRELVEENCPTNLWNTLPFYNDYPYYVTATISTIHGTAMEFVPSDKEQFETRFVDERIEQAIFNDEEGSTGRPMFRVEGKWNRMSQFSANTTSGYFVDVTETGSLIVCNVWIDGIEYDYLILIKGSNAKRDWDNKVAATDARHYYEQDIIQAFVESEDFREFVARPELEEIAIEIIDKEKAGDYYTVGGFQAFTEDFENLYTTAKSYNITNEFTDSVYEFLKQQRAEIEYTRTWWDKYWMPLTISVIAGLIVAFIIFIFRRVATNRKSVRTTRTAKHRSKKRGKG